MIGRIRFSEAVTMRQSLTSFLTAFWFGAMTLTLGCTSATPSAPAELPLDVLKNLAYKGVSEDGNALQLTSGRWKGEPPDPESAAAPTLDLSGDVVARGDLDGDGRAEAVVILDSWTGGSGVFSYMAVVSGTTGQAVNIATELLGDRVQVRDLGIEDGKILVDLRGHGPDDPSCCPSMSMRQTWQLEGRALRELTAARQAARVTVTELEGSEWVLARWRADLPAPSVPVVSLSYAEGRFSGNAGCNRYGAAVRDGDAAGGLVVSQSVATRMACEEPRMRVESRFLQSLSGVQAFRFSPGTLMLAYRLEDGSGGELWFKRAATP